MGNACGSLLGHAPLRVAQCAPGSSLPFLDDETYYSCSASCDLGNAVLSSFSEADPPDACNSTLVYAPAAEPMPTPAETDGHGKYFDPITGMAQSCTVDSEEQEVCPRRDFTGLDWTGLDWT